MDNSYSLLDAFCNYLITERYLSPKTVAAYHCDIKNYLLYAKSTDQNWVAETTLNRYLMELPEAQNSTLWRKRSAMLHFFKFLTDERIIEVFNTTSIYKPKRPHTLPKALSTDQVTRLLDVASQDTTPLGIKKYAFVSTMYFTATRVSECAAIKLSEVEGDRILVTGKRDKSRWVFMTEAARATLNHYMQIRHRWASESNPYLWGCGAQRHVLRQTVHRWLQDLGSKAGVSVSPHTLRHTQATQLLPHVNICDLSRLLGHANIDTTSIYLRVSSQDLRQKLQQFHPLGK